MQEVVIYRSPLEAVLMRNPSTIGELCIMALITGVLFLVADTVIEHYQFGDLACSAIKSASVVLGISVSWWLFF